MKNLTIKNKEDNSESQYYAPDLDALYTEDDEYESQELVGQEEEVDFEKELELIKAEEIEAANIQSKYFGGRTHVSLELEDGTKVTMCTPGVEEIQNQDRIVKNAIKYDKAGNRISCLGDIDATLLLIRECVTNWGGKKREDCNRKKGEYPVSMEVLGSLSQYDLFRISEGFARVQLKRRSRQRGS